MATESRPRTPMDVVQEHSAKTAEAFQALRRAVNEDGPLPTHIRELIVSAAFATQGEEGAFRTPARRALVAGASPEELRHAVLVTLGANATFPKVAAALRWVESLTAS